MFDKIKQYAIIALVVLAVASSFVAYTYINKYNEENALKNAYAAQVVQNDSAYINMLNQKNDTIQTLAVNVKNLNSDVSKKDIEKGYWKLLASTYKVKLDSVQQHGTGIASSGKDSSGEYGQVNFSGEKGIVSYDGWTKYYFSKDAKPLWFLDLEFKQFPIYSFLYQDVDKIWKIKSFVDESGIKFTAFHNIDSSIFISYKSEMTKPVEEKVTPFGLRLKGNIALVGADNNVKPPLTAKNVVLDASAEVYYDYWNITYYPVSNMFSAGVVLNLDISKIFKIF